MSSPKKVFVGMSGGVDSSVSAALLQKQGYDVTGVFIKVWHPEWLPCEWKEERRDAMRVAAKLNIPFLTLDLEKEYKKEVADYMIEEYRRGNTPNPDVMCNKEIKFGSFLKFALDQGADFIATGHYAQNNPFREGADKNKDQSYFLWTLSQDQLKHVLFPIGQYQKSEVRKLAEKFHLPTATKKDSQGICFIGKVDMKEFLSHYITPIPGDVLNEAGEKIGTHDGALFYTIGQRHGFTIQHKTANDKPYYIVGKNTEANTLTVSEKFTEDALKTVHAVTLKDIVWNAEVKSDGEQEYMVRARYRQNPEVATIKGNTIHFKHPQQGISLGQSIVVYDKELCLGGGIIDAVMK